MGQSYPFSATTLFVVNGFGSTLLYAVHVSDAVQHLLQTKNAPFDALTTTTNSWPSTSAGGWIWPGLVAREALTGAAKRLHLKLAVAAGFGHAGPGSCDGSRDT
jgi:hypothetical protein